MTLLLPLMFTMNRQRSVFAIHQRKSPALVAGLDGLYTGLDAE